MRRQGAVNGFAVRMQKLRREQKGTHGSQGVVVEETAIAFGALWVVEGVLDMLTTILKGVKVGVAEGAV
jgi:hypothetical protein